MELSGSRHTRLFVPKSGAL